MRKLIFFIVIAWFLLTGAVDTFAQKMMYKVDLKNVVNDKVKVELKVPSEILKDTLYFNFPSTVPGTYATEDYGRYVEQFAAMDDKGTVLPVKKKGNNTFVIYNGKSLKNVSYWVNDSWDAGTKENKIFEPAGSNIDERRTYTINGGAFFGFFDQTEKLPIEVKVTKHEFLYGASAMKSVNNVELQTFNAKSYHSLVDSPILFGLPDTTRFRVGNANVTIMCVHESGKMISKKVYEEIKPSMLAIEKFLKELPVSHYVFLVYVKNFEEVGKQLEDIGSLSLKDKIKLYKMFKDQGFGALEHSNSSLYYLPDFGKDSYKAMVKDVCIHEFMHIVTPLNLHSERIGDFNYVKPEMSKHLWLYEGITEYFSGIIQVKGGLMSPEKYIENVVKVKMEEGERFPFKEMSFAEMSENVLDKKYHKEYNQVYSRGAVLGMLLDIEIIKLTKGEKTLIDVVLELTKKYGPDQSFSEQQFIDEFVAVVHPDLKKFFDCYITGREALDYASAFSVVGLEFIKEKEMLVPRNPITQNDVKFSPVEMGGIKKVKKVGKQEWAGLKPGDAVNKATALSGFKDEKGEWLKEGETGKLKVMRGINEEEIPVKIVYQKSVVKNEIIPLKEKTAEQEKYYKRWLSNSNK